MWAVWWEAWESARSHELRINCKGQCWSRTGVRFMSVHRPCGCGGRSCAYALWASGERPLTKVGANVCVIAYVSVCT